MFVRTLGLVFLFACGSSSAGAPISSASGGGAPTSGASSTTSVSSTSLSASGGSTSLSASSTSAGAGGASMQGLVASPGVATGAIHVVVNIQWDNVPTMHKGNAQVIVQDAKGNLLSAATVVVTPLDGAPLMAVSTTSPGIYNVALTTLAAAYDVSVMQAEGTRTGIVLLAPAEHTVTLAGTPAVTTALPITWAPNGDSHVSIDVRVDSGMPVVDWIASSAVPNLDTMDTGAFTIPADAFPGSGSYDVFVVRGTKMNDPADPAGLIGLVTVTSGVTTTP